MRTEQVSFGVLLGVAIYGLFSSLQMPIGGLQEPGPGFFPICLSALLFLLAGFGMIISRSAKLADFSWIEFRRDLWTPTKIVLCYGGAIYFFESAGFLIISTTFLSSIFWWVSGFRVWKAFLLGIAGGVAGWFIFVKLLGVVLPEGIFSLG